MRRILLEVCTGDFESVCEAVEGGADRIELCSALSEGGITPSDGMLAFVRKKFPLLDIQVLIRPRSGDFLYTKEEVKILCHDIQRVKELGANGIVIGALTPEGDVDVDVMRQLISKAAGMKIVFHRAFDLCNNPEKALETIIALGCCRVLTSGCAASAESGIDLLRKLVLQASGRITIMPGGGISEKNVVKIIQETGVSEVHASLRKTMNSMMNHKHSGVSMGTSDADEYTRLVTDSERVKQVIFELRKLHEQK